MGAGPRFTPPGKHLVDANAGLVTEWGQVGVSPWENIMEQGEGPKYSVWGGKLVWRGKGAWIKWRVGEAQKGPRREACGLCGQSNGTNGLQATTAPAQASASKGR